MTCYWPTPAYQKGPGLDVEFWPRAHLPNLGIPCGTCIGCRSSYALQWAQRCSHEASFYDNNIFLTLTYDQENLPDDGLKPRHLQLFIKRLRKCATAKGTAVTTSANHRIRYFACGEYGQDYGRPHYHLLLFNCELTDKYRVGKDLYSSDTLSTLWPHGLSKYGTATPGAANYIALYSLHKQGQGNHDADGVYRHPPFLRMSNRPAIGSTWLNAFATDLRHGYLLENNHKHTIPRAYRRKLEEDNPLLAQEIQLATDQRRRLHKQTTEYQLRAGELIHKRLKQLTETRTL